MASAAHGAVAFRSSPGNSSTALHHTALPSTAPYSTAPAMPNLDSTMSRHGMTGVSLHKGPMQAQYLGSICSHLLHAGLSLWHKHVGLCFGSHSKLGCDGGHGAVQLRRSQLARCVLVQCTCTPSTIFGLEECVGIGAGRLVLPAACRSCRNSFR